MCINKSTEKDDLTEAMDREVDLLTIAEEQIQATGTLSEELYEKVFPLVEDEKRLDGEQSEMEFTPTDAKIDNEFLRRVHRRKIPLEQQVAGSLKFVANGLSDHLAYQALPPAEEMEKILRYESRVQKQLDRALQRLWCLAMSSHKEQIYNNRQEAPSESRRIVARKR